MLKKMGETMKRTEGTITIKRLISHPITVLTTLLVVAVSLTWGSYKLLSHYIRGDFAEQMEQVVYGLEKDINEVNLAIGIIIVGVASIYIILCYKFLVDYRKYRNEISQMEKSKDLMVIKVSHDGKITYCNRYARETLGYSSKEIREKAIFDVLFKSEYGKIEKLLKAQKLGIITIDLNFLSKNYKKLYTICTVKQIMNKERENTDFHMEISAVDITLFNLTEKDKDQINELYEEIARSEEELQKKYEELCDKKEALQVSEERYSMVIDTASIGIWDWDLKEKKIYCSPKVQEIFNCQTMNEQENIDLGWIHPDNRELVQNSVKLCTLQTEDQYDFECRVLNKYNKYIWVYIVGKILRNQDNTPIRMTGSIADINDKKINEERIKYMAYYDELTGLANKNYLKEIFEEHKEQESTFLYLDVDNFKFVNDSFGYKGGDQVLAESGKRFEYLQNDKVTIARVAADEFAILLKETIREEEIKAFIEKLNRCFEETFIIDQIDFGISFSIGVAIYTKESSDTFEDVLNKACTAMHRAKDKGKRNYIFFEDEFKQHTLEKIQMESELRQAIQKQEFALYYQPQMKIETGKVKGFEALIRWIKEDGTMIPPDRFISVAEETGLMVPIGSWVVEEACRFINKLKESGLDDIYVAVNISVVQLIQDNFAEKIEEIIEHTHVEPERLHIEITETMLMESIDVNIEKVEKIKEKGVKISLDDFGKGYSSLTYLKQLPINVLKIEKAFVDDILQDEKKNITGAIINLGHELSLEVVAEGVEEEGQLEYLKQCNCDLIQGYLFSRPIPEEEAIQFIQDRIK